MPDIDSKRVLDLGSSLVDLVDKRPGFKKPYLSYYGEDFHAI